MMRYRLRTLLIFLALGPPFLGWCVWPKIKEQFAAWLGQPATQIPVAPASQSEENGRSGYYGYLGAVVNDYSNASGMKGLKVTQVSGRSPAAASGLIEGDVITSVGNFTCRDLSDMDFVLEQAKAGTKLPIVVMRGGKSKRLIVTLGTRPPQP